MQLLIDGEEFSFDRDAPAVRYIRFEVLKVHSESLFSCLSEIKLWGQIENDDPDGPNESNVNDKKD